MIATSLLLLVLFPGQIAAAKEGGSGETSATVTTPVKAVPAKKADPTTASQKAAVPPLLPVLKWGDEKQWELKTTGEQRIRFESRHQMKQIASIPENDKLVFLRHRLAFDLTYRGMVRVFLEMMDSREADAEGEYLTHDPVDLHQLFVDLKDAPDSPLTVRLGRQEMVLGGRRLVESSGWANLPRTFEGGRLIWKTPKYEFNMFLLQPDMYDYLNHDNIRITGRNHLMHRNWFYGMYNTFYLPNKSEWDLYAMALHDLDDKRDFPNPPRSESGKNGTSDRYTVGSRLAGPLVRSDCGTLGYGTEGAFQFGQNAGDPIRAWFARAEVNYEWKHAWKPRLVLEGNLASGDRDPEDGTANGFNPLFGGSHGPYGIMDYVRLQNLREIAVTGSVQPTEKLKLQAEYHHFWLDSKTDSWSSAYGLNMGRDKQGRSGRSIGDEISLMATYNVNRRLTAEAGVGRFLPGGFAENVGRRSAGNFFYLQTVFKF